MRKVIGMKRDNFDYKRWSKDIKAKLEEKDMTYSDLAEAIAVSYSIVVAILDREMKPDSQVFVAINAYFNSKNL
ncbi:MAG: helix-turn-helix transcriptional regulator [Alphaproteobacteria bacterium]|nr:helix-turn-helix transcriptional regulator [Alphaproteobacteria bacterium]